MLSPRRCKPGKFGAEVYDRAYLAGSPLPTTELAFASFPRDLSDFVDRFERLMNEVAAEPRVCEQVVSWCRDDRVVIIKNMRALQVDVLPDLELADSALMQHLSLYEFRSLAPASIAELEFETYTGYLDTWILLIHPLLHGRTSPLVSVVVSRYARVRRLRMLVEERPKEFTKAWYEALEPILMSLAPKLVQNLTPKSTWDLVSDAVFRAYAKDDVVFEEGDPPDGYYVCVYGAVAIHKLDAAGDDDLFDDDDDDEMTTRYGKRLVELKPGAAFGEVGFSAHSTGRAATVVASGEADVGDTVMRQYCQTVCYVVSADTFDLVYGERTKQFDAKVATLKANALYQHWTIEDQYRLAVRMQKKLVKAKSNITYPDRYEVAFIRTGAARIYRQKNDRPAVEVAVLGSNEIFGLCEMCGYFDGDRWAVAETDTEAYIVSLAVARELSATDSKTYALLLERAEARRCWETACLAAKSQDHVVITFEMMKYAKYGLNPDQHEDHAAAKARRETLRPKASSEFEFAIQQADKIVSLAATLEGDGSYLEAEDMLAKCVDMCKDKLRRLRSLKKDGLRLPQHAAYVRDLRQRVTRCEERSIQLTQLKVKSEMDDGRLGRRIHCAKANDVASIIANRAFGDLSSDPRAEDPSTDDDDDSDAPIEDDDNDADAAQNAVSTDEEASQDQPPFVDAYERNAPSVTDEMDTPTRRRACMAALDFALDFSSSPPALDHDASSVATAILSRGPSRKHVEFPTDDPDERKRASGRYTVLNHLEVTPLDEVKRHVKRGPPPLGVALKVSRRLHESASLLSLDQERCLGKYGLPALVVAASRSVPDLHAASPASRSTHPPVARHQQSRPKSKGPAQQPMAKKPRTAEPSRQLPALSPRRFPHVDSKKKKRPHSKKRQPPATVQRLLDMHRVAEQKRVMRNARRFELYAQHHHLASGEYDAR